MERKKMTVPLLTKMKEKNDKITCLTAYDWCFASLLDAAGIDLILIGDSASMVFAGNKNTLPATMEQMIYHSQVVSRGVKQALVITDMPFLSYQISPETALQNAGRFVKECGVEGVKVEGGEYIAETIRKIVTTGIPVMGHLGLTPQSIHKFGSYTLQGKNEKNAKRIIKDAKILEEAGAFSIVLEKIPSTVAKEVTLSVSIPTIGIGAGPYCDGQILVTHDMLGLFETFKPKFARKYEDLGPAIKKAVENYINDIKNKKFPNDKESF
ncbi:MAG: 3-methyl-2-oxobutanoate hydroxymethyltransferase [bacterium]